MTSKEALERIRDHLDKRSGHSVVLTERMTKRWWNLCNVALFKNKLYPPHHILVIPDKNWGYCERGSNSELTIVINSEIQKRGTFLATLIHEMVHQWEIENHGVMGHGKRFFVWKDRIQKQLGLDIHIDIDEEDYNAYGQKQLYRRRHKGSKR